MSITQELLLKARTELDSKSLAVINRETALLWAARAMVAFANYRSTGQAQWLHDATEYQHEAIEHAALSGDTELLGYIRGVTR